MKGFFARQVKLLAVQWALLSAFCAIWLALSALLSADALAVMYGAYLWALCPALGAITALRSARRGLTPYLALWGPAVCPAAMQLIVTGTALDMRAVLAYALVGLVSAAAGEELRRRNK